MATVVAGLALPATATAAPGNDMIANARNLSGQSGRLRDSNFGATREAGEVRNPSTSVWYRWTATRDGWLSVDTCLGAYQGLSFDTYVTIYDLYGDGTLTGAKSWLSNDDGECWYGSQVIDEVSAGTTYFISVSGCCGDYEGRFVLRWQFATDRSALTLMGCNRSGLDGYDFRRVCTWDRAPRR